MARRGSIIWLVSRKLRPRRQPFWQQVTPAASQMGGVGHGRWVKPALSTVQRSKERECVSRVTAGGRPEVTWSTHTWAGTCAALGLCMFLSLPRARVCRQWQQL